MQMTSCGRWLALVVAMNVCSLGTAKADGPYQATGIKIGEVTSSTAIVWSRLTLRPERNPSDGPAVEIEYEEGKGGRRDQVVKGIHFPEGCTVSGLREAVPGTDGDVRVLYRPKEGQWQETSWQPVDPLRDFTQQIELTELQPGTSYEIKLESRSVDGTAGQAIEGTFRTAPKPDDTRPIRFAIVTCFGDDDQDVPEGFKLYRAIAKLDPDFFVHTGDIVYYDKLAKTLDLARYHWQRMYSWPTNVEFHKGIASYFIKDDHDTWRNDCWPTMKSPYMHDFTFRQGQGVFREQVPMGDSTYRTIRWGKDLQIWLVEGRDFRSPHAMKDGPEKTIWGSEQMKWFQDTVAASDATFKVLLSATPIVGPDRSQKLDNHANRGFAYEGNLIREFLAKHQMINVCGDRHWQYLSVDPKTKVREYSVGPGSDPHAGGWKQEDYREDYHRFLRVKGGFLTITVERSGGTPTMTCRFHDTDGGVQFEDVHSPEVTRRARTKTEIERIAILRMEESENEESRKLGRLTANALQEDDGSWNVVVPHSPREYAGGHVHLRISVNGDILAVTGGK